MKRYDKFLAKNKYETISIKPIKDKGKEVVINYFSL